MSADPCLRDATPADAGAIAAIYNETIAVRDATMVDEPQSGDGIRAQMAGHSEREGYLLLERDEEIIGWGVIKHFGEGDAYRFTGETSVFLRRDQVRKGYGTVLKRALIKRCRAHGYHHLVARVWATNEASIAYNQQFGYEVVGIQREIGHMNGRWQDVALMQLLLNGDRSTPDAHVA
ncbi:MAG: N-acetyltransferase family protein [Bacteroidota bacterium]